MRRRPLPAQETLSRSWSGELSSKRPLIPPISGGKNFTDQWRPQHCTLSQGATQSSVATSPVSKLVVSADCKQVTFSNSLAKSSDCKHGDCTNVQELHQAVCSQMMHTEEAVQTAICDKVCLLTYATELSEVLSSPLCRRRRYNNCMLKNSSWQIASNSWWMQIRS